MMVACVPSDGARDVSRRPAIVSAINVFSASRWSSSLVAVRRWERGGERGQIQEGERGGEQHRILIKKPADERGKADDQLAHFLA